MRSFPSLCVFAVAALTSLGRADKTVTVSVEATSGSGETKSADKTVNTAHSSTNEPTTTTEQLVYVTVAIEPLTTVFRPPKSCNENRLTQLASPGYMIWVNEPQPVADSKMTDCFPPEFISRYTSVANQSSSIAPLMSPLVCPEGWHTAKEFDNGYIACCASGYLLAPPSTTSDENRPAYGGTCYSNFKVGQTATVTAYNETEITATADWVATTSVDQAYGHVIDGYAMDLLKSMASASSSSTVPTSTSMSLATEDSSTDISSGDSSSNTVSGGAIAGIVVGSVVGLVMLAAAVFWFSRRRRLRPSQHQVIGELGGDSIDEHKPPPPAKDTPGIPKGYPVASVTRNQSTATRQTDSDTSTVVTSPLDGAYGTVGTKHGINETIHENENRAELDSGWKGHELGGT